MHLLVEIVVIDPTYNASEHFNSHIVEIKVSRRSQCLCLFTMDLSFESKDSICDPVCEVVICEYVFFVLCIGRNTRLHEHQSPATQIV